MERLYDGADYQGFDNIGALDILTLKDAVRRSEDIVGVLDGVALTYRALIRYCAWADAIYLRRYTDPVIERRPPKVCRFHCALCQSDLGTVQDVFAHSAGLGHLHDRCEAA